MPKRKPFVGGNWKMNGDSHAAADLARAVGDRVNAVSGVDIAIFPPAPYLTLVRDTLHEHGSNIALGGQNMFDQDDGAFTGEVSAAMLADCGCEFVLVGHSERRHVFGEGDEIINRKVRRALISDLKVVLCIGETLDQREAGRTDEVNEDQLTAALAEISARQMAKVTIAYEPVWAIGTGMTATPDDAQNAHAKIRSVLRELFTADVAAETRIQYGGSVKPSNAAELFGMADIDGGLIGGASLKADDFAEIVRAAMEG